MSVREQAEAADRQRREWRRDERPRTTVDLLSDAARVLEELLGQKNVRPASEVVADAKATLTRIQDALIWGTK